MDNCGFTDLSRMLLSLDILVDYWAESVNTLAIKFTLPTGIFYMDVSGVLPTSTDGFGVND